MRSEPWLVKCTHDRGGTNHYFELKGPVETGISGRGGGEAIIRAGGSDIRRSVRGGMEMGAANGARSFVLEAWDGGCLLGSCKAVLWTMVTVRVLSDRCLRSRCECAVESGSRWWDRNTWGSAGAMVGVFPERLGHSRLQC